MRKKYMRGRVCDPPYIFWTLRGFLLSGSDDEAERFRGDNVHILVLDDQQDSEEIRGDRDECLSTHGSRPGSVQHPIEPFGTGQQFRVLGGIRLSNRQHSENMFEILLDHALVLRYFSIKEHTSPLVEFHYMESFICDSELFSKGVISNTTFFMN